MLSENTSVRVGLLVVLVGALYWLISAILLNNALGEANAKDLVRHERVIEQLVSNYGGMAVDIATIKTTEQSILSSQDRIREYLKELRHH